MGSETESSTPSKISDPPFLQVHWESSPGKPQSVPSLLLIESAAVVPLLSSRAHWCYADGGGNLLANAIQW